MESRTAEANAEATKAPVVPRWVRICAYTVPLLVLPSALFRFKVVITGPVCDPVLSTGGYTLDLAESAYVVSLSVLSMGAALLTLGLVQRWGEVVPRWVPLLGGRRVPVMAAFVPAILGAVINTALSVWQVYISVAGVANPNPDTSCVFPADGPANTALTLIYLPLTLWGPLVGTCAVAYLRRRRRTG